MVAVESGGHGEETAAHVRRLPALEYAPAVLHFPQLTMLVHLIVQDGADDRRVDPQQRALPGGGFRGNGVPL